LVQVTPTAPTPTNAECTTPGQHSDATLVIPTTAHVVYKINGTGSDVSGQTLIEPVGSSLNVVATPAAGYKFTGPQTVTYPVSFTDPGDCLVTATPVTPTLTQSQCDGPGSSTPASIDIPSVTGVIYQIAGETVSGSIPVTAPGTVIVTAIPAPGYAFPVDAVTTWTEQFTDAGGCLVGVTVASPSFTNDACSAGHPTNGASYTIPATEHVTYTINGTAVPAGTYAATDGTTVTIIAVADEGYSLTGSTTFTHTFPVTDCVISVIPASASFAESVCTASGSVSSATYTVPNSTRVVYSIGGAVVRAGTHNAVAGSTVTIVATAVDGFTLSGVTQWTHTFGKTATCLDTGGTTTHRPATGGGSSGGPTANTGAPVAQILLTGIALILMGAACYLMAGTRRPRHGARRVMTIARRRRGLPTT
jgi:hypothetical protein